MTSVEIPNRPVFRAQEVCEIADVQPYVLRTWEAEFPDLGVSKSASGPRLYRRADVERVLRIKHLILVEGLTLAGARRQLVGEPSVASDAITDTEMAALIDGTLQQQLRDVRQGLRWILETLSRPSAGAGGTLPFETAAAGDGRAGGARRAGTARVAKSRGRAKKAQA